MTVCESTKVVLRQAAKTHRNVIVHASDIHIYIQDDSQIIKDAQCQVCICSDVVSCSKHLISKALQSIDTNMVCDPLV